MNRDQPSDLMLCLAMFSIVDKVKPSASLEVLRQCIEVVSQKTETPPASKETPSK
jgi:hypothetical protein